jgi:methyl-galactoside transport system permease protein
MEKAKTNNRKLSEFLLDYAIYFILGLILVVVVILEPEFLSITNFVNILTQASTKGILALGCAGLIVLAGTDLSLGRIVGLSAAVTASLVQSVTYASRYYLNITEPVPLIIPFLLSIGIATAISAFNGFGVAKLKLHAFIVTLGTSLISYGITCTYIENQSLGSAMALSTFDKRFVNIVSGTVSLFGVPIPYVIFYFLIASAVVYIIWNYTTLGKNMFAVGGNTEAAAVSGVNITRTIIGVYIMAGILYGIGAFLEAARIQSVSTNTGFNYELDAISACVIGGISFSGGVGNVPGIIVGVVILQAINYSLYFLDVNAYLQFIIKGCIIVVAVAIDVRKYVTRR